MALLHFTKEMFYGDGIGLTKLWAFGGDSNSKSPVVMNNQQTELLLSNHNSEVFLQQIFILVESHGEELATCRQNN